MKQNITLRLEKSLIQRARVVAARRSSSVSALLTEELISLVERAESYERSKRAALADLEQGFHLGWQPARKPFSPKT